MNQVTLEDGTINVLDQNGNVAFQVIGDRVTDLQGNVALRYRQDTSKLIRLGDGTEYLFMTKANACIAWVQPKHVDQVLAMTHQCCGGNRNVMFKKTNALTVYRWLGLGEH
jgi:hypothetical protein